MITDIVPLDWALISMSLFNALLLLWLGLIVFLNAERRTWGLWLLDGGLMLGALFFISHTAMLGHHMTTTVSRGLNFWWRLGWIPVILAPLVWHITILWYAGFWDPPRTRLRRHWPGLVLTAGLAASLLILMLLAHALPTYTQIAYRDVADVPTFAGMPLLFLLYPPFALLCIVLPLDALDRPEPSARMMGDLARKRARPWLLSASLILLLAELLISGFFAWALNAYRWIGGLYFGMEHEIAIFDLLLSTLIALVVILTGQALVSYEIFTGKTLPRRGFFRHWRSAILLAAGYAALVGGTIVIELRPIYSMLLATLLVVIFYALFSWQSFVEREQFMMRLRPFVDSSRSVRGLLHADDDTSSRANSLFRAVCKDVLGASQAHLIPLGALAPLAGSPLSYPDENEKPLPALPPDLFAATPAAIVPLDPATVDGLQWAIPLWAERGLIGVLLLGSKQDGGLYTQEEIEMARASAERIIDTQASEQIARRLVVIQRRRLAETRVLDLRTRRALHDEILPELHMVALRLSALAPREPAAQDAIRTLTELHRQISDLIHVSGGTFAAGPNGDLVLALRMMINDEFDEAFSAVTWRTAPTVPALDPLVQEVMLAAAREAVRNAALHGRGDQPDRPLNMIIEIQSDARLSVIVCDDGVGLSYRARSAAGAHETAHKGSGGGLTLHGTMLAVVGGELSVESLAAGGTRVIISIPV